MQAMKQECKEYPEKREAMAIEIQQAKHQVCISNIEDNLKFVFKRYLDVLYWKLPYVNKVEEACKNLQVMEFEHLLTDFKNIECDFEKFKNLDLDNFMSK